MKKTFLSISLAAVALSASATTPLWLRDIKISPDGTQIAFTYKGDIYKVATSGGDAIRLTTLDSYEATPIWSPDGKTIAFTSDRNGGQDIFTMSANGGKATRITFSSESETPEAFTPDGKEIIYSAALQDPVSSAMFPSRRLTELYSIPVKGGRTKMVIASPAQMISYTTDGESFLYQDQKGMENEWRKHHTSSITRDIWLYNAKTQKHSNLTNHAGEDRNPVMGVDGKTVYFLSERKGGSMNVYSFPIDNPQSVTAVTSFKTHPVRFLSQGADGTLAFSYNGEIFTKKEKSKPSKVAINITSDDENELKKLNVASGASAATVSPDGKQIALIYRGELFVTSTDYTTTNKSLILQRLNVNLHGLPTIAQSLI